MKIIPYGQSNSISFKSQNSIQVLPSYLFTTHINKQISPNTQDNFTSSQPTLKSNTTKILIGGAIVALGALAYAYRGKIISIFKREKVEKEINEVKNLFPDDIPYKKELLSFIAPKLGIDANDTSVLNSIVGKTELSATLKTLDGAEEFFSQGQRAQRWVQDTNSTENIDSLTYRANLHIHTTHSDGKMSVGELLDQAVAYADRVANKTDRKAPNVPYTIAICDHDTVNGCKEAVEIIAQNPEKYKNLRVVLGTEISTYHDNISDLSKNHRTHLLAYNINPYEGSVFDMLSKKQADTNTSAQEIISKMNEAMSKYWDYGNIQYNIDEAKASSWCIRDGLNTVKSSLKDYFEFKKVYQEVVTYNDDFDLLAKDYNISKDDISFDKTCRHLVDINKKFARTTGQPCFNMTYWEKYLVSLKLEILKKIYGDSFVLTKENFDSSMKRVDKYFKNVVPNLKNSISPITREFDGLGISAESVIPRFDDAVSQLAKDKSISLGIAHPAFVKGYDFGNGEWMDFEYRAISEVFKKFKVYGRENALYYEKNYPYFHGDDYVAIADEFLEHINKEAKKHGLSPSGSLDNHGGNIFKTE